MAHNLNYLKYFFLIKQFAENQFKIVWPNNLAIIFIIIGRVDVDGHLPSLFGLEIFRFKIKNNI